ncbi:MAG: fibronectin type III domain-containing protein [Opitutales bacterium]|nr:fibronectin type III domain-containing protein [Opitutales bacterium]
MKHTKLPSTLSPENSPANFFGYIRGSLTALGILALAAIAHAQPTNNPVAAQYVNNYPVWTDAIQWENVIDMSTYANGENHFERFENARDELHAQGGGVLYYPAGTYHFDLPDMGYGPGIGPTSRGLMLKSGVVIRGADPVPGHDQAVVRASEDPADPLFANDVTHNLTPQTVFTFPMQMRGTDPVSLDQNAAGELPSDWNLIGITPGTGEDTLADVTNVGIVNIKLDGGVIYWGYHTPRAPTMNEGRWFNGVFKTAWPAFAPTEETWAGHAPTGEHYMHAIHGSEGWHSDVSAGSGRLAMNVKIQDGATFNDMFYPDRRSNTNMFDDTFSHYRFTGRLTAHGGNIFIANNVLAKPTKNFVYREIQSGGEFRNVLFDYANHIGIDVNKSNFGGNQDNPTVFTPGMGYYAENVIVRNNWVFNRGNKNFEISGTWAKVINNHAEKYYIGSVVYAGYITNPQVFGFDPSSPSFDPMATLDMGGHTFDGWNWRGSGANSSDYMNRGYDFGGRNLWVHRNSVVNPGSIGNDGEGLIAQEHNRVGVYSWAWSENQSGRVSKGPGTIGEGSGKGWIGSYNMQQFGFLLLRNAAQNSTSVGTIASSRTSSPDTGLNWLLDVSIVGTALNGNSTDGIAHLDPGHSNFEQNLGPHEPIDIIIIDDVNEHTAAVSPPEGLSATLQPDNSVYISWTDTADNEVGFRVERRVGGQSWKVIAYRPLSNLSKTITDIQDPLERSHDGTVSLVANPMMISELNPQAWRDYTAPVNSGETIEYRVIAINALDDDSTGVSDVVALGDAHGPVSPEIPRAVNISMVAGSVSLHFVSQVGVTYQLQRSYDLDEWVNVGPAMSGDGETLTAEDNAPGATEGLVFYRFEVAGE